MMLQRLTKKASYDKKGYFDLVHWGKKTFSCC